MLLLWFVLSFPDFPSARFRHAQLLFSSVCFRWCHIKHLNPQDKYPQRIKKSAKQYIKNLDYTGIEFPVTIKQFSKIEKQNKININVFGYEEKQPYPIYISKEKNEDHMDLLLITENENNHYVLIKDFNKFMYNQTKHKERKHFCMYCLQCFRSEKILANHKENCIVINGKQAIKMPTILTIADRRANKTAEQRRTKTQLKLTRLQRA